MEVFFVGWVLIGSIVALLAALEDDVFRDHREFSTIECIICLIVGVVFWPVLLYLWIDENVS